MLKYLYLKQTRQNVSKSKVEKNSKLQSFDLMLFSESRSLSNPQNLLRADFPNHRRLVDVFCPCKVFAFRRDLAHLDFKGSNPGAIFQKLGLFTSASVSSSVNGEFLPPCGAEERRALRPP